MPPSTLKRLATEDGSVSPPATKRKLPPTTTKQAVANFFTPISQKEPEKSSWRIVQNSLLVCKYDKLDNAANLKPKKIAAFDFDSTLITTKSGTRFGRDAQDWRWWHASVEARLQKLVDDGYLVAIVSNQAGISLDSASKTAKADMKSLQKFKAKASAVLTHLDLPITLYAATSHDQFRKPRTAIWDRILKDHVLLEAGAVDLEASFFVGDAAGRTATVGQGPSKDFSCSDRDFAANVGISFHTPEEFFLGEMARPFERAFEPTKYLQSVLSTSKTEDSPIVFTKKNDLDIVLFVGSPGAGKSTFYWDHLKPLGYERVNQDILKSRDRCLKVATECLQANKSVAVDNTNADMDTRIHWISLAKSFGINIRCVLFTASTKLCEHNDTVRALGGPLMNPESRTMLPKQAFSGFASRYREPSPKEGFQDVTKVDFEFQGTAEQRAIWSRYWISG